MKTLFHGLLLVLSVNASFGASLFRAYPALQEVVPHVSLCEGLPTPITRLTDLEKILGMEEPSGRLFIKDDSKTSAHFGGNKPRKLEFLLARARQKGCNRVVTQGGVGSNHCCATATHARHLGLACTCVYSPQLNTAYLQRNLLLSAKAGAVMLPCADRNERRDQVAAIASLPGTYLIPPGGSSARGCLGFVNAAFELKEQIERGELPCPDEIYITFGSSGSVTGLLFGLKLAGLSCHVTASCVVPDAEKTALSQDIVGLFGKVKKLLRPHLPEVEHLEVTTDDVTIDWDHYNEEYARISVEQADAMRLLKFTSGISVDGTYAGKTFTALCDHVKANPALRTKKILFWNTFFSGLPTDVSPETFTALQKNYATLLPKELHQYFDGSKTISPLDQGF